MTERRRRVTQRDVARLAGVSQATVSMVLNDRVTAGVRIPEETRRRVREALEQARYVADPAARRLVGADNGIFAVFTYEPALDPAHLDFYAPFLNGIEVAAERLGVDLLLLTGAPVRDGRRDLLDRSARFRITDGCILLGQQMNETELESLVEEGFACVAVGRRELSTIPYVGVDYHAAIADLLTRARDMGHRRFLYLDSGGASPSERDRRAALADLARRLDIDVLLAEGGGSAEAVLGSRWSGQTCILTDDVSSGEQSSAWLVGQGHRDVSVAVLAEVSGHSIGGRETTGFVVPRTMIGDRALTLLHRIVAGLAGPDERHILMPSGQQPGGTLVPVSPG